MKKITKVLVFALLIVMVFGAVQASAYSSYETYTYSIDGNPLKSPDAYRADGVFDSLSMHIIDVSPNMPTLSSASDLVTDNDGNVYIADKGNNRIVVLNKYYQATGVISTYTNEFGEEKQLWNPQGIFVTNPELMAAGSRQGELWLLRQVRHLA